jgi:hypothetical protein
MKPRENTVNIQPSAQADTVAPEVEVSADAVQPEASEEVELEQVLGESRGEGLGLSPVQNLDSQPQEEEPEAEKAPIVAQEAVFESLPTVPQEAFDTLEALMAKSQEATGVGPEFTVKPIPGREYSDLTPTTEAALARSVYQDGKSEPEVDKVTVYRQTTDGQYAEFPGGYDITFDAVNSAVQIRQPEIMGQLPNGDYRATVIITEVYVEGCKQQAESDGISLEDWLTGHLGSYLENWWGAPGAR